MAIISVFCFVFSVRLGSIITGIFTLIQSSMFLAAFLYVRDFWELTADTVKYWIDLLKLEGKMYREIANEPKLLLIPVITLMVCLFFSSIFLMQGAFQCNPILVYPFCVFYLLYIIFLVLLFVFAMTFLKISEYGLEDLILYSNLGVFVTMMYSYTWACTVSLIQIIYELRKRLRNKLKMIESLKNPAERPIKIQHFKDMRAQEKARF